MCVYIYIIWMYSIHLEYLLFTNSIFLIKHSPKGQEIVVLMKLK